MINIEDKYSKFFDTERRQISEISDRTRLDETYSDHSRVIFASVFRRLQQKAQVFSLETNSYVRSRMTHSLEVADYGRTIATKIALKLKDIGHLKEEDIIPFFNIVEVACLLHDIGNPPFGHFGEKAIQIWFKENWENVLKESLNQEKIENIEMERLYIQDFLEFDGNPQGFRIITKIQGKPNEANGIGLNLTKTQLFCFLKYIRCAGEGGCDKGGIYKKAGFFNSEKSVVEELMSKFNHRGRHPLTYIMEVADDIAYCISDIEDGIEKEIMDFSLFHKTLILEWNKITDNRKLPKEFEISQFGNSKSDFFKFKTNLARELIEVSVGLYLQKEDEILEGQRSELLAETDAPDPYYMLQALKRVSRRILFRSKEAEDKELAGYTVIRGLLDKFAPLLKLSNEEFNKLLAAQENPEYSKGLDIEWRLFNRLPPKYVDVYKFEVRKFEIPKGMESQIEWFFRAHLIVDFIAGMTDSYALDLYKLLNGIEIH